MQERRTSASADPSSALLRRWQEHGDLEALDELLRIEVGILRERILRRHGNLLRPSRLRFTDPAVLRAYLLAAAWRLLAKRRRGPRGATSLLEPHERQGELRLALELLHPQDREVLQIEQLEAAAVAERLQTSTENARRRLERARKELAKRLAAWNRVLG